MTVAPGSFAARIGDVPTYTEEEDVTEFGELIFSSKETSDCFIPTKERALFDWVTFLTSTTATTVMVSSIFIHLIRV